jgi:hypothetical protein
MKKICCIVLSVILFSSCKKETFELQWTSIETGTRNILYSITAANDTLFAFGGNTYNIGEAVKFSLQGDIISHDSISPKAIYGSCFYNINRLRICGYDGMIFTSENFGNTWYLYQTNEWIPLQDIQYKYGWHIAVGGIGGRNGIVQVNYDTTWQWHAFTYERELKAVAIVDSFTAFAVGQGIVLKTANKGQSWSPLTIDGDIFTDIQFVNSEAGFILGYSGVIYKTINGGKDWNKIKKRGIIHRGFYNDLHFVDTLTGFICGNNGVILKTEDGGNSWQQSVYTFNADLYSIWFSKQHRFGYACGSNGALIKFSF